MHGHMIIKKVHLPVLVKFIHISVAEIFVGLIVSVHLSHEAAELPPDTFS